MKCLKLKMKYFAKLSKFLVQKGIKNQFLNFKLPKSEISFQYFKKKFPESEISFQYFKKKSGSEIEKQGVWKKFT